MPFTPELTPTKYLLGRGGYMKVFIIVFNAFFLAVVSASANSNHLRKHADDFLVEKQLNLYFQQNITKTHALPSILKNLTMEKNCNDSGSTSPKSCVDAVCTHLGAYGCDDMSEIKSVASLCKNNLNGDCVNSVCKYLGQYGCDDMSEVKEVASVCSGHINSKCVEASCSYLGQYGCDDFSEIKNLLQMACTPNVDGDCVKSVCQKLGQYGCDDFSEIKEVTAACAGN
jgi:hypothetical protein